MSQPFDAFTAAEGGWMFSRVACPECSRVCRGFSVPMGTNKGDKLLRQGFALMETYPGPLVSSSVFRFKVCAECAFAQDAVDESWEVDEDLGAVFRSSVALRVLEEVWADIRSQVPLVPDAVVVLASGIEDVKGPRYGHWAASRWRVTVEGDVRAEVMVAGEGLNRGAVDVMGTLLHEAAHGIAHGAGEQDCSRQGRYHNKVFKRNAESLGLEVGKRSRHGWAETALVMTGRNDRWWWAVRKLEAVCALGERLAVATRLPSQTLGSTEPTQERNVNGEPRERLQEPGEKAGPPQFALTNGQRVTLSCGCRPVRRIRVVASVASLGEITCGLCSLPFRFG